ncbi:MAG: hypothetical protein PF689_00165 [Deltaproteobacteria bacterium]|jgi:hypothetical protein|nr:hypothetical protein [Deltaproteobacteria bacterium]
MNLLPRKLASSIFFLFIPLFATSCTYDTSGLPEASEICDNQIDDDNDGYIDCNDNDCANNTLCNQNTENCTNSLDDDDDDLIDCNDPDCSDHEACLAEICDNGIDDDNDTYLDCEDQDCFDSDHCQIPEICDNQTDDDNDGLTDCEDPECENTVNCLPEICDNGTDDDNDELTDCEDPDCANHQACLVEICDNGNDEDHDGLIDCNDLDCKEAINCLPEICDNQTDDNANSKIDCLDPQCFNTGQENSYEYCGRCNPYTNEGCSANSTCYVSKDHYFRTFCFSSAGTAQHHEFCSEPNDCAPGLFCTYTYNPGNSTCVPICYPDVDESCPNEYSCFNFSYWGNGPTDWGVCWSI